MNQFTFECEKICFKYGTRSILEDITTQFKTGHLYGILGPNGSGKTTLIKIMSRILKQKFGDVYVDGINLKEFTIRNLAKKIAVVNQTNKIEFDFTVNEIVKMGRFSHVGRFSRESEKDKEIIKDILQQFDLYKYKDRKFNHLSGGEQQKVIIARAIAQQSKILLFDEPTTHLDINYQIEFMERLVQYVNDGYIIIVVLHDLNLATQYCNKIILLNGGRIKAFGNPEDVITRETIRSIYKIDAIIKKNIYNNSIYVTPLREGVINTIANSSYSNSKKIHVIGGGGSASQILPKLKHFDVSIGVVNVLDDDFSLAKDLGYDIISEAPFSPISEDSREELNKRLQKVELVILANIPFGKNNIRNLHSLQECMKPILIFEKTPIEDRDFTGGVASSLYAKMKARDNVKIVNKIEDLINFIMTIGGCDFSK